MLMPKEVKSMVVDTVIDIDRGKLLYISDFARQRIRNAITQTNEKSPREDEAWDSLQELIGTKHLRIDQNYSNMPKQLPLLRETVERFLVGVDDELQNDYLGIFDRLKIMNSEASVAANYVLAPKLPKIIISGIDELKPAELQLLSAIPAFLITMMSRVVETMSAHWQNVGASMLGEK